MDCKDARPLLDANADHELPAPDAQRLQQHLAHCDACRRASAGLRALNSVLRGADYHRAPQSLRALIVAGLPSTDEAAQAATTRDEAAAQADMSNGGAAVGSAVRGGAPASADAEAGADAAANAESPQVQASKSRPRWPAWLGGGRGSTVGVGGRVATGAASRLFAPLGLAAVAVAMCAATALVTLDLRRPASGTSFTDELVESHVRAQISGRDIDVVSSDRHTVKPWFNGRLDYTPPVEDLAASGYALTGGRLDYVGHRRVAVLVYRYRKHVIDVYVFPQTDGLDVSNGPTAARDGFSVARWNALGMTWWAVSDAAPDALSGLEAALNARLEGGSQRTEGG